MEISIFLLYFLLSFAFYAADVVGVFGGFMVSHKLCAVSACRWMPFACERELFKNVFRLGMQKVSLFSNLTNYFFIQRNCMGFFVCSYKWKGNSS